LLEEIRALTSMGRIERILLTLFIGLQVTARWPYSAPDMDHAAGRLDKSSFANVMASFLLVDH
jgi:hypothetical protein